MKGIPFNPYRGGICRTIKAQCQQTSMANLVRQDGLGATGVIVFRQGVWMSGDHFSKIVAGDLASSLTKKPKDSMVVVWKEL